MAVPPHHSSIVSASPTNRDCEVSPLPIFKPWHLGEAGGFLGSDVIGEFHYITGEFFEHPSIIGLARGRGQAYTCHLAA
jgi:hypothetical protein